MKNKIIDLSNKYENYVINMRRKIHGNPELAFEEFETSDLIERELKDIGLEVMRITETGVVGILNCGHENIEDKKVILLRADIDALPLQEETNLSFKSKNKGVMHACGHDVHTANLLGVARILKDMEDDLNGVFKFVFQHAEERGGGARELIEKGVLENPKVDVCIAMHVMPTEQGIIEIGKGNISSNSDEFIIQVLGERGHTSRPQEGVDAINIAGHILTSLNSIISRKIDPLHNVATYSIGKIQGGTASNIISDRVIMEGMMRTLDFESRDLLKEEIEKISRSTAQSFGGDIIFDFNEGYPSIVNNPTLVNKAGSLLRENMGIISSGIHEKRIDEILDMNSKPMMASEDFGFYSIKVPSVYLRIGTGDIGAIHSQKFDIDEEYIKYMTRIMCILAISIV